MDLVKTAEKRFLQLAREYKARKAAAESRVCTWTWATKDVWHLNPLYFEMNAERPGRRLQKKPAAWKKTFSYGIDDSGRVVVERDPTEFGSYETFYDWSKNPVEVAYTHPDFAKLVRRRWLPAVQTVNDGRRVGVITTDGQKRTLGKDLDQAIGEFLVSTLLSARNDGLFQDVPRSRQCQLGVEDPTTGAFGWPKFDDRGKKNLV